MGASTLLHLVFPIIISLLGIFILLSAIRKQKRFRAQIHGIKQAADQNILPNILPGKVKSQKPLSTHEDARLAKLGFSSLSAVMEDDFDPTLQSASPVEQASSNTSRITDQAPQDDNVIEPPEIIVLHILAKSGKEFVGYELLQAILACGFRFGDMDIFHRHQKANGHGKILFSLASAVEPGTFDMNAMGGYHCLGLTLFMRTAQMKQAIAVFDLMLNTAQELADDLDGIVMDAERKPLQASTITHIRQSLHYLPTHIGQAELDFSLDD